MSPDPNMMPAPTPTPTPAPVADDSGLSLEIEPLVFFHPTLAGLAPPGSIQPFPGPFPFDEEPAIWLQLAPESEPRSVGADTDTTSRRLTTSVQAVPSVGRRLRGEGTS